jgi:hypothetical protein
MLEGVLPPHTSKPEKNPHGEMIDAQYGLYLKLLIKDFAAHISCDFSTIFSTINNLNL